MRTFFFIFFFRISRKNNFLLDPRKKNGHSFDVETSNISIYDVFVGVRKVSQLTKQMQQWQEDLDLRLKGKKIPPKYWEYPELEK